MYNTLERQLVRFAGAHNAKLSLQFARYFIVALIGFAFDFGTLVALHDKLHVNYLIAAACGFIAGLVVNYILSSKYVFKDSKLNSRAWEFFAFCLIGLIGLGILSASMWILTSLLGVYYIFSKCLATAGVYIWNFIGRKALYRD